LLQHLLLLYDLVIDRGRGFCCRPRFVIVVHLFFSSRLFPTDH
jgi:hypothetical protein